MSGLLFGLLGSGEFEPWSAAVDQWLLERAQGDGTVLILPTASAPEGDDVFDRWGTMGLRHFASLDVPAEVAPLKTRDDAEAAATVARIDAASMVYFSGGNPAYLARTLSGTAAWRAVLRGLSRGMAYVGCSAGIACLGEVAADSAVRSLSGRRVWEQGLRLFPRVHLGPHWDALDRFVPGLRGFIEASVPREDRLLAIDEETAAVGDGSEWMAIGAGSVHLREDGEWRTFPAGSSFDAELASAASVAAVAPGS